MGLRLKSISNFKHRIAAFVAVMAVAALPAYGFVAKQVANAEAAPTIYVNQVDGGGSTTDNIYATIGEAITASKNGDIIVVSSGEYNEKVAITKNITLRGETGAVIIGPANSQAIEVRAQDNVLNKVTIEGFTVNAGVNSGSVLNVSNGTGPTNTFFSGKLQIRNLTINSNNAPAGIGLMRTDGVTIDNVIISEAKTGIEVVGAQNLTVKNSTVKDSTIAGINVWNTTGYGPRNNVLNFTANTLTNNPIGLRIADARNVTVTGGTVTGGYSAISAKDTTTLKISGATMSGQRSVDNMAVIGLVGLVEHADVSNNIISDAASSAATAQAILLGDTSTSGNLRFVVISGNTIKDITGAKGAFGLMVNRPMSVETGAQLKFTNNTISGINGAKWMAGIGLDAATPAAELVGNSFSNLTSAEGKPVAININNREGNTADITKVTVKQNNFNTPGEVGVNYDWAAGTAPKATALLDVSENYWGDIPGPGKGQSAVVGQYTKMTNWLCNAAPSSVLSTGESKGCVQPIVESVTPGAGAAINGTKRVYVNIKNPEVMNGGFLQLNKAAVTGNPSNSDRTNYPLKKDETGKWYAEIDTTNIVALSGSSHQGDGKYLFRVEAHHKYGHDAQHPWGTLGNQSNWGVPSFYFMVDNTAPSVSNVSITPLVNVNIGGNVTVQFELNDVSGINLNDTYVMFADGPDMTGRSKESAKVKPVQKTGNVYTATFNTKDFVKANYIGKYNLQFTMVDSLGNRTSSKPKDFRPVLVDNSGPSVTMLTKSGQIVNGQQRIEFKITDDTGVGGGYAKLGGLEPTYKLVHDGDDKWYVDVDTTKLKDGYYKIDVRPTDSFGEPRYNSNIGNITIDNTAPDAMLQIDNDNPTTADKVVVKGWVVAEPNIKSHFFEVRTPTSTTPTYVYKLDTTDKEYSFELDTSHGAGLYTVRYVAADRAGNRNDDPNYQNTVKRTIVVADAPIEIVKPGVEPSKPATTDGSMGDSQQRGNATAPIDAASLVRRQQVALAAPVYNGAVLGVNTETDATDDEVAPVVVAQNNTIDRNDDSKTGEVLAAQDEKASGPWKLLADVWYLWVLALAGLAWWIIAAVRRKREDDQYFAN